MSQLDYMPWPYAIESFNWYAPESILQVPMEVFQRMVDEAEEEINIPVWWEDAINSGAPFLLMAARTFVKMLGDDCDEVPEWMLMYAMADYLDKFDKQLVEAERART